MKKLTLILFICLLMFSFASAKEAYLDVNNVRFYFGDSEGYFTGPQFPQKAGGLLNDSFPTPGGRTYAFGPLFIWGNGITAPGPVADELNWEISENTAWDGSAYTAGAFVTGSKGQSVVANTYVINTWDGVDYSVSNVTTSAEGDWYNPNLGTGDINERWPYSNKEYAYNPASFRPWVNVNTGVAVASDAFLNLTVEGALHLFIDDLTQITEQKDYIMIFDGTDFNVYDVTGYDTNGDPLYTTASAVSTFAPDTTTVFNGISINMGAGTSVPVADGDAYLIKANGVVGDMDLVLPITDAKWLATGAQMTGDATAGDYGKMDVVVLIRAYAWTASYLDTTVVFDITFDNQSARTYDNFAAGVLEYFMFCDQLNDTVQYHADKNLLLMYDYDGKSDVDVVGAGSDDDIQWNTGDFGTSPYAMIGMKILKPLTKEGEAPSDRFSLYSGYTTQYFTFQNGFSDTGDITGMDIDYAAVVQQLDTTTTTTVRNSCNPTLPDDFGGWIMRTDGSFNTWLWGDDIWDTMVSGRINYCYDPAQIENPDQHRYYYLSVLDPSYGGGYRRGAANVIVGWYLGALAPSEKANMVFAIFTVQPESWGWAGAYPTTGDPAFDSAVELSDALDLLYESKMAPSLSPVAPDMIALRGYSENYGTDNSAVEIEFGLNSETSYITALAAGNVIEKYIFSRYDGTNYTTILELRALLDASYWEGWWDPSIPTPTMWDVYSWFEPLGYGAYLDYYFPKDENYDENHIIWIGSDLLSEVLLYSDASLSYKIGVRVNEDETAFESYVVCIDGLVFGYDYKYIVQAQDYFGNPSAKVGDNNFELVAASGPVSDLTEVRVVPNPLFVGTRWDQYAEVSEVKFNHIPGECTIKIYNTNGDLLKEFVHDDGNNWASWDLLTKYNQEVAPGMYIYVIESDLGKTKGTFAVVR